MLGIMTDTNFSVCVEGHEMEYDMHWLKKKMKCGISCTSEIVVSVHTHMEF